MAEWDDGVSASCTEIQLSVSAGNGWPHNALRHHWRMPISCHFQDCKELLVTSLAHVSGAITSAQTFTFAATSAFQSPGFLVGQIFVRQNATTCLSLRQEHSSADGVSMLQPSRLERASITAPDGHHALVVDSLKLG